MSAAIREGRRDERPERFINTEWLLLVRAEATNTKSASLENSLVIKLACGFDFGHKYMNWVGQMHDREVTNRRVAKARRTH